MMVIGLAKRSKQQENQDAERSSPAAMQAEICAGGVGTIGLRGSEGSARAIVGMIETVRH